MDFVSVPFGASNPNPPRAEQVKPKTTRELVTQNEPDTSFFRALEEVNVCLNDAQLSAVRHVNGPILTVAGAGSGKTSVLASRTAYLVNVANVDPNSILLVTFTRKAAEEMKERIGRLPGLSTAAKRIECGTFHSIFWKLLRQNGYTQNLLTSEFQKQVAIKKILRRFRLHETFEAESAIALISSYKVRMLDRDDPEVDEDVNKIWTAYDNWKYENDMLDFDDLMTELHKLLRSNPKVLQDVQSRFKYLMVDEWQDTTPLQYDIIKMIAAPDNNLFVVGDPRQLIYSWNGADINIIMGFDRDFPNAKVVELAYNYRSTPHIVGLGNAIVQHNKMRVNTGLKATKSEGVEPKFARPYHTDGEAENIIRNIQRSVQSGKRKYRDFAVLYRTTACARAVIDSLVSKGIPYVSFDKGELFYENGMVKPVVQYFRLSVNPLDMSALETVLPTLYLSRETTMEFIQSRQKEDPRPAPITHILDLPDLQPYQQQKLLEQIVLLSRMSQMRPVDAFRRLRLYYDAYLDTKKGQNLTMAKEMIKEILDELESALKWHDTVEGFIAFVDHLIEQHNKMDAIRESPDVDAISLMTIHKSKGLEFPVVYLIGASEGIMPHGMAIAPGQMKDVMVTKSGPDKTQELIEEERRLAYVAVTRAKEELYISSPATYRGKEAAISRFLLEAFGTVKPKAETTRGMGSTTKVSPAWRQLMQTKPNPVEDTASEDPPSEHEVERIPVMACTGDGCNVWKRISSVADEMPRMCPKCGSPMAKTMKIAPIEATRR